MGERGVEPPCLAAPAPKAGVYANFTTRPRYFIKKCYYLFGFY